MRRAAAAAVALALTVAVARAAAPEPLPWAADPPAAAARARVAALRELGRRLFFDVNLSASRTMSCASCHDPANHFAPANALAVQFGGPAGDRPGTRAVPSLAYGAAVPFFSEHYYESDDEGDESRDQGPTGGRTWDGRVNRARDQAAIPLLAANEMANADAGAVVARVAAADYAGSLRDLYGGTIFADVPRAFAAIGEALEAFEELPAVFSPFTSKYDAFLRGQATFTDAERRGLAAFNDPGRGNCAQCHPSKPNSKGDLPLFTDHGLVALGVPRNRELPANADPHYHDLGACGPLRRDLASRPEYCGLFRTPTLRNVATRRVYFHNGALRSLEDVVAFYATRDTSPGRWYARDASGRPVVFDDLPAAYRGNVNREPPFGRTRGDAPALTPAEVADVVAFLRTLTDGYQPGAAAEQTAAISAAAHRAR
ncbi:MAG: c-type cytochrome [Proteobacteria bacterium]|nr:c-type cytochrome [Pseudomonadota bacterium]